MVFSPALETNLGLQVILFVSAVTLHMAEEVIWLPAWSTTAGRWHEPVTRQAFGVATAIMLAFVYLLTAWTLLAPAAKLPIYLMCGLALVMIVNVLVPHLGATITLRRYAPGLATSILLVLPAAVALLREAFSQGLVNGPLFVMTGIMCLAGTAIIWPSLFHVARA